MSTVNDESYPQGGVDNSHQEGDGAPDGAVLDEQVRMDIAAAAALARAREVAAAQGFRPTSPGRRRRPRPRRTDEPYPGTRSGGRDPRLIGEQFEHLLVDRGWQLDVSAGAIVGRWRSIVGDQVAEHCEPVRFEDGVLTVKADSPAWASNLRLMTATVLTAIEQAVPDTVTEVQVVGPDAGRAGRGGGRWGRRPRR